MIDLFNAGNINPLCEGFLTNIYKAAHRLIDDRLNHPELGELDVKFVNEAVERCWEKEMSSPFALVVVGMMDSGQIPAEQAESFRMAKKRIFASLCCYIRTDESPAIAGASDADEFDRTLPVCNGYFWTLQKRSLSRKYHAPVVASIDRQSSRVLKHILMPEDGSDFRKMGLVLGQVQSGKTANYSALIAKACDYGYKLVIVLSGIHNDLRQQTQERLDEEFLGYHEYKRTENEDTGTVEQVSASVPCGIGKDPEFKIEKAAESATYTDDDFRGVLKSGAGKKPPVLFVIKKQTAIFKKVNGYFRDPSNYRKYRDWPMLVIDDEADLASVNTKKGNLASATNRCIRMLLERFPKAAYVGYTATPFANVLIDAQVNDKTLGVDLFPRDFIVHLPAPRNYFGAKQFFGDNQEDEGLDLFMPVSDEVSDLLTGVMRNKDGKIEKVRKNRRFELDELPAECRTFFLQFLLSAGIRQWRHKKSRPDMWREDEGDFSKPRLEMSMLVHVSSYVRDQTIVARRFAELVEETRELMKGNSRDRRLALDGMEALFEEQRAVTARTKEARGDCDLSLDWSLPESLDAIVPEIEAVLEDMRLRIVNGEKHMQELVEPEEASWCRPHGAPVLFVGGNKLSRGLTLPGLCVSLFLRSTTMYDTLLQMGRWFGYRDGYVDLCRICTTTHVIDRFRAVSEACLDFERQVDRMTKANRRPENYRLNILSHTGLLVTARNKMVHAAEAKVSFNGAILDCRDVGLSTGELVSNWRAVKALYDAAQTSGRLAYASKDYGIAGSEATPCLIKQESALSGRLWRDVPGEAVLEFLDSYLWAGGKSDVTQRAVAWYVRDAMKTGGLVRWNVFLPGQAGGGSLGMKFVERSMKVGEDARSGWIKALKTGAHEYVGVPADVLDLANERMARGRVDAGHQREGSVKRGEFYAAVREAAGELHPDTGYLIVYLMRPTEGCLPTRTWFEEARSIAGEELPAASYYLWLPKTRSGLQTSMAVFNETVVHKDEDDWDEDYPEMEDEE